VGLGALVGAGVTAFYMTRLMLMTFFSHKRWREDVHPHESPSVMTTPLIVLAALSVVGGALALSGWIGEWLAPVAGEVHHELGIPVWAMTVIIHVIVAVGVALPWLLYQRERVPSQAAT